MAGGALLGLDIGTVRTGIAISRPPVHIPVPLETIAADMLVDHVQQLVQSENVTLVVAGLPRNLQSEDTAQTVFAKEQIVALQDALGIEIATIDESLTSKKAEAELESRKKPYQKEDVDMLAATYILEDYMREHPEALHV